MNNFITRLLGCTGISTKHVVDPLIDISPRGPLVISENTPPKINTHIDTTKTHKETTVRLHNYSMLQDNTFWDEISYSNTKPYIPDITCGKVVKVYDADTITIANHIYVGSSRSNEIYRFQVRLHGIDSPEIKSKNPTTKALAIKARDVLSEMISGKIVQLQNVQLEKYGRLLADVYLGDLHLNQWLIDNKYAVVYNGGTKNIPEEWETE
jgi:micrococcal nuclease